VNTSGEQIAEAPVELLDFQGIFLTQFPRIVRIIVRIVDDSGLAEDLAMEVFLKLWRTPPRKASDPGGWLYRTAVRAALDELRRRARRQKYESIFGLAQRRETPDDIHSAGQRRQRVRIVLASIHHRHAELLILRSDGFSYEDAAHTLGLNPASIGTLLRRAQEAFRKEYVKRYGEEY
jgi:RNA polymerase sigma-70 factor (ECF subfamily)